MITGCKMMTVREVNKVNHPPHFNKILSQRIRGTFLHSKHPIISEVTHSLSTLKHQIYCTEIRLIFESATLKMIMG